MNHVQRHTKNIQLSLKKNLSDTQRIETDAPDKYIEKQNKINVARRDIVIIVNSN